MNELTLNRGDIFIQKFFDKNNRILSYIFTMKELTRIYLTFAFLYQYKLCSVCNYIVYHNLEFCSNKSQQE